MYKLYYERIARGEYVAICVKSEILPLKKVMLQRPGQELEHLIPGELERLLFDDIPFLQVAQQEHDRFAEVLRENGVEVVYLDALVAQTLQDTDIRSQFIDEFIDAGGCVAQKYKKPLKKYLSSFSDMSTLVRKTMAGVSFPEIETGSDGSLSYYLHDNTHFVLDPIPNLYFTRDPFACVGNGVTLHHMYSVTRNRETIYGRYVLKYHPDYAGKVPLYYTPDEAFTLEGGDVLNLSEEVLAVGISQRTMPDAIERLAANIFSDESAQIRTILAMDIPSMRAFMHLDTVMTMVDYDKFVIHPGVLDTLRIFELTPRGKGKVHVRELKKSLETVLRDYLHLDSVSLIRCGGRDMIASQREQWNDGSNTLCIAPGKVIAYDRNYVTNQILEEHGICVLKIPSSELSRGRGGPRCMSMPLIREEKEKTSCL